MFSRLYSAKIFFAFLALFLGATFYAPSARAASCEVTFLIANDNDNDSPWSGETSAQIGDTVGFYLGVCNYHEGDEPVIVRVDMPTTASGKVKATLRYGDRFGHFGGGKHEYG